MFLLFLRLLCLEVEWRVELREKLRILMVKLIKAQKISSFLENFQKALKKLESSFGCEEQAFKYLFTLISMNFKLLLELLSESYIQAFETTPIKALSKNQHQNFSPNKTLQITSKRNFFNNFSIIINAMSNPRCET